MAWKRSRLIETGNKNTSNDEKVYSEFYLRICESAEEDSRSLPYDTGLDGMPDRPGQSDFAVDKNLFKEELLDMVSEMEPGETRVTKLVVKVYRNKEPSAPKEKQKLSLWA